MCIRKFGLLMPFLAAGGQAYLSSVYVLELLDGCWDASSLSEQQAISHIRDDIVGCIFEASWAATRSPAGDWRSEASQSQDGSDSIDTREDGAVEAPVADQVTSFTSKPLANLLVVQSSCPQHGHASDVVYTSAWKCGDRFAGGPASADADPSRSYLGSWLSR